VRDFIIDDQAGEVLDARAIETSFDSSLLHVEGLDDGYGVAVYDVVGTMLYEADLEYDDLDTAIYDSEDKRLIVWQKIEETLTQEEIYQAEITVTFSLSEVSDVKFDVIWNSPLDVRVQTSHNDGWPYK
jgi:hypothetical protein